MRREEKLSFFQWILLVKILGKSAYIIFVCKLSSNFASNVKVALKGFHFVKTSVQGLRWINEEIQRVTHFKPGHKVFELENALQLQSIQGVPIEIHQK